MSVTTTIRRGNLGPVWDKPVPDHWLFFYSSFLSFCWSSSVAFENSPFKNLWRINCLGCNFVQCGRIHFTFTKILNKLISTKIRVFISLVVPSETEKLQLIYYWLKIGTFQTTFDEIHFFINIFNLLTMLCKKIENLEFVRGVNFEIIDSLKSAVQSICQFLTFVVMRFAIQRALFTLPPLGDIWVLAKSTLNTTFFTRAN